MKIPETYLFQSDRLGFRNWSDDDLEELHELNSDPQVMEFFPSLPSREDSAAFIARMKGMYDSRLYCYFAVELINSGQFIGFIGLCYQDYESPFTPCVDIGWRLAREFWGKGYATEGAKRSLEYAFAVLELKSVRSVAPVVNKKSIQVMKKVGMREIGRFTHSKLLDHPKLSQCSCFEIKRSSFEID